MGWIKERILSKVEGWKEKLLNQAGKEVLIKAVLQAIPSYAMSIIRFPKTFCKEMCSIIARFWWSNNGKARGIHWKSWDYISGNKKDGGMGFKDFTFMNSAMLAKQAWRAFKNPSTLWASILKSIYHPNVELSTAKRKRGDSLVWRSLFHGRDVLKRSGRWLIGDGRRVDIQQDNWLPDGGKVEVTRQAEVEKVCDIIDHSNSC